MSINRKKDAAKIKNFVGGLKQQSWLNHAQKWWPDYLYRVDNITAAAKILNMGRLLSRDAAQSCGLMDKDCASPDVIRITNPKWRKYVRLYFRPCTPTQYDSEGFRPPAEYVLGAHCPIPIVMLFDSYDILTRETTVFSNGSLAKNAETGSDSTFLRKIPFKKVYHNSSFEPHFRDEIVFHRHAEVVIPDELDMSALKFIGCRTHAEYETLYSLLQPEARNQWSDKIGLGAKLNLHYRRWTFVEEVELSSKRIQFRFNPSSITPGPFKTRVEIRSEETSKNYFWEESSFLANSTLTFDISRIKHMHTYLVRLLLNDDLAYVNQYFEIDTPF